jgi:hypothetical protein
VAIYLHVFVKLTLGWFVIDFSVTHLQDAIMKRCHIPRDKQVLLISGGDNLDPSARVCSYSAGTVSWSDLPSSFLFNQRVTDKVTKCLIYILQPGSQPASD